MTETCAPRSQARSETSAGELLGARHPLARADERVRWLGRQAATAAALLPAGGVLLLAGGSGVLLVLPAAALVAAVLLLALAVARDTRRTSAVELVAQGRGALPIVSLQRQRERLARPGRAGRLAASIEALRREARAPYRGCPRRRLLYVPAVVRQADAELARTAELLRSVRPDPATVARVELLLGGATSPLYEDDAGRLREELNRICLAAVAEDRHPALVAPPCHSLPGCGSSVRPDV